MSDKEDVWEKDRDRRRRHLEGRRRDKEKNNKSKWSFRDELRKKPRKNNWSVESDDCDEEETIR